MLGSEVPCLYLSDDKPEDDALLKRSFWVCVPCQAYVLTHKRALKYGEDGTTPLGPLANQELRRKRFLLHEKMDPIWKQRMWTRDKLYKWLANRLGLPLETCHIAMLSAEDCDRATVLLEELAQFALVNKSPRKKREEEEKKNVG